MGTVTINIITLNAVTHIERPILNENVAVHDIPGDDSQVQVMGRRREILKVHGILTSSDAQAILNLAVYGQSRTQITNILATVGSQDWATTVEPLGVLFFPVFPGNFQNQQKYYLEKIDVQTEPGTNTAFLWGKYVVTLRESQ